MTSKEMKKIKKTMLAKSITVAELVKTGEMGEHVNLDMKPKPEKTEK
jgi:predicted transcriptional regulator